MRPQAWTSAADVAAETMMLEKARRVQVAAEASGDGGDVVADDEDAADEVVCVAGEWR